MIRPGRKQLAAEVSTERASKTTPFLRLGKSALLRSRSADFEGCPRAYLQDTGGETGIYASSFPAVISACHVAWAEKSSADAMMRTPTSRQRNEHIQQVLVEAAIG